jgi:hypothetical protein
MVDLPRAWFVVHPTTYHPPSHNGDIRVNWITYRQDYMQTTLFMFVQGVHLWMKTIIFGNPLTFVMPDWGWLKPIQRQKNIINIGVGNIEEAISS